MKETRSILIVDDEPNILELIHSMLDDEGYKLLTASSVQKCKEIVETSKVDIIISDIKMPQQDGLQLLSWIKENYSHILVILVTGHGNTDLAIEALRNNCHDFLEKPFDTDDILNSLEKAVQYIQAEEAMDQENQDIENFAYLAAHDLLEPSQSIKIYIELLIKSNERLLTDKGKHYLARISQCASRMTDLTNSLLDLANISTGELEFDEIDLSEALNQAQDNLELKINESNAAIHCDKPLGTCKGNLALITSVFQNLISNAIKYCDKENSEIWIESSMENNKLKVTIKDNGIGITEDNLHKIFEPFYQINSKHKYGGTGLGLANCHRIIKKHQGKIWAKSVVGQGSTFYVELPKIAAKVDATTPT